MIALPSDVLASTASHFVEHGRSGSSGPVLFIVRRTDGHCIAMTAGRRAVGEFRDCLRTHSAERVIACYLRMAESAGCKWSPLYKATAAATMWLDGVA